MNDPKDWFLVTYTGLKFHPFDPSADEFDILDIAHALANACRYAGHVKRHYSVAQHSVYVSVLCPERIALEGLLHDAAEAYCCDIPRPIKRGLPDYVALEHAIEKVVREKFGLVVDPFVKTVDLIVFSCEARDLFLTTSLDWDRPMKADPRITIEPTNPVQAEAEFLRAYEYIMRRRTLKDDFDAGRIQDRKKESQHP